MKKKLFIVAVCLLLAALVLTGCSHAEDIATVNRLRRVSYSSVHLTVTVSKGFDEFVSTFDVVYDDEDSYTVTYDIQLLATFGNDGSIPENFTESYQGVAKVENDLVTSVTGQLPDGVNIQAADGRGFIFSEQNLSNVKVSSGVLTAKVSNPKAFMKQAVNCKSDTMSVRVSYSSQALNDIRLQYTSISGNKVVLLYTYTV